MDKTKILEYIDYSFNHNVNIEPILETIIPGCRSRQVLCLRGHLMQCFQYYWFVKNDITKAKQYLYLFGKCIEIDVSIFDGRESLKLWVRNSVYLLLSDNQNLINKFAYLKCSNYEELLKQGSWVACIQAVLRDDLEFLKNQLQINIKKDKTKSALQDLAFFEGIIEGNKDKMETAINLLATKFHKRRNDESIINELLSIPAIGYLKLAWLKGYKIQIDNPLIPMEMVEINPNKEYWDYDFMKKDEFKCD